MMFRSISILAAGLSALMIAAPALAQPGAYYVATPAAASTKASFITRNTVWHCEGESCTAKKSDSRDQVVCQLTAQRLGKLNAFVVNSQPFDEAALATCNARAR